MYQKWILELSNEELEEQFWKEVDYRSLIDYAWKYHTEVLRILNSWKWWKLRPLLKKLKDSENKIHIWDIYMAFGDFKRAIREYSKVKDWEKWFSEAQKKILAITSIDIIPFTWIWEKEESLVWWDWFLDKLWDIVFDYNWIQVITNNWYPWLNYSPHPYEQDIVDTIIWQSPLVNPLYVVNDTANSHNLLMFWDIENGTNRVKSILRKTLEWGLLSRFPADRTNGMVTNILDSALSLQARSVELFGRVSKIYQTWIIVPENSTIEARLVSTNHLIRHPTKIPMSSLYTIDWEKYADTARFRELRMRHREEYEQTKWNLQWKASINP